MRGFCGSWRSAVCFSIGWVLTQVAATAAANERAGPKLGEAKTQRWQFGMKVTAKSGPCSNVLGTVPVPVDWPEQQVRQVDQDVSPFCPKLDERTIAGNVRQLLLNIPRLPAGEEAIVAVTLEITKQALLPPDETSSLKIPDAKKLPKDMRLYLGIGPFIESNQPKIKALAKEITSAEASAWDKVEALFDWVRDNVEANAERTPLKGAARCLKDRRGDAEDLVCLFIALCRASGVPARTVWVPMHCYPEFYLIDEDGQGHWYPCEVYATREFGGISDHRPVLQKGDNFRIPEYPKEKYRLVPESLEGVGRPSVRWIRKDLDQLE